VRERVETTVRFVGDWPWGWVAVLAVVCACAAWTLYRRELSRLGVRWIWWAAGMRATAIAMTVFMLSGPVLHHRKVVGDVSRLLVFLDGSLSMGLKDRSMGLARQVLVLESLGMTVPDRNVLSVARAAGSTGRIRMGRDWETVATDPDGLKQELIRWSAECQKAADEIVRFEKAGGPRWDRFRKDLCVPIAGWVGRNPDQAVDGRKVRKELAALEEKAVQWEEELGAWFEQEARAESAEWVSDIHSRFEGLTRWDRVKGMLLCGEPSGLLARLAAQHDVEVVGIQNAEPTRWWRPTAKESRLPAELPVPRGGVTDLASSLRNILAGGSAGKTVAVLISDGQHNDGPSPVELAKALAAKRIPVFTVGVGSGVRPQDLAVLKVEFPQTVFFQDRVRGEVVIKQDLPAGTPFKIWVRSGDRMLAEKSLRTDPEQIRKVALDFPVAEVVKAQLEKQRAGVEVQGVPLDLEVGVSAGNVDGESGNDTAKSRIRAVTQKRKVLLVDGRPRWETRYLRNLFERDEQWEVNAVVAGAFPDEAGLARGSGREQFPVTASDLMGYDLVVLGEVPRGLWKNELEWIRDFVGERGGGLLLVDGARNGFREYGQSPVAGLFPVEWSSAPLVGRGTRLEVVGSGRTALNLAPERTQNAEVWSGLEGPGWVAGSSVLPGAEVWVEAVSNGKRVPAVVYRQFGAGRVLYHGMDETWRWRRDVADRYHTAYWRQVADFVAELPFAVKDRFVSLDAGSMTYRPGESAEIRMRLRDGDGKPVKETKAEAVLFRDGKRVASVPLKSGGTQSGLFLGKTAGLEPGEYEVAVEAAAIPDGENRARTGFTVEPRSTGELSLLNLNEELLRAMAVSSGGRYLREEDAARLETELAPLSEGKVIELDTALWESYYWLIPLVAFLGIEWVLRKRAGLI
jgi:hypothetical protein